MKKSLAILAAISIVGCGRIETGNVGLRTDFNGTVSEHVEPQGFYTAFVGHVDQYTTKEIAINLENLQPKAKDNLSLKELDVTVFYQAVSGAAVRALAVKRAGQSVCPEQTNFCYPAYSYVASIARSEVADAVSRHDSLTLHTQRNVLEAEVKKAVQESLDKADPGALLISRVIVRQITTDPTVENAIRNVVAKDKELEAATKQVQIAEKNAEAVAKTANTLTPAFLQHEYNQALMVFAQKGGTVILDGSSSNKIINVGK